MSKEDKAILVENYSGRRFTKEEAEELSSRTTRTVTQIMKWSRDRQRQIKYESRPGYRPLKRFEERVILVLEQSYRDNDYEIPGVEERRKLAKELGLTMKQVKRWYDRTKLPVSNESNQNFPRKVDRSEESDDNSDR